MTDVNNMYQAGLSDRQHALRCAVDALKGQPVQATAIVALAGVFVKFLEAEKQ